MAEGLARVRQEEKVVILADSKAAIAVARRAGEREKRDLAISGSGERNRGSGVGDGEAGLGKGTDCIVFAARTEP